MGVWLATRAPETRDTYRLPAICGGAMTSLWSSEREALDEVLADLGFSAAGQSGVFVTYERERDSMKVHVAPDGMFAAFNRDDNIIGEGEDAEDLRSVLLEAVSSGARGTLRESFLKRRTRKRALQVRPTLHTTQAETRLTQPCRRMRLAIVTNKIGRAHTRPRCRFAA
jgi:hypothetical protein